MKYKRVMVSKRGGPEVLQIVEQDLVPPGPGQARIKILATPVCQDDVAVRQGKRPFLAKPPYVPGYSVVGRVDAIGPAVTAVAPGDLVAALTGFGGYAEYLYWDADQLMPVPQNLDPAQTAVLILNYLTVYQVMHRVAQVKPGDKVLIIGASGGIGTAFLQLGQVAGLKMIGLASQAKHGILREYGATPIDYREEDIVRRIKQLEPQGLDFVFNGMGEEYFERGLAVLRRGGMMVHYGGPQSFGRFLLLAAKLIFYTVLPNGKRIKGYGTHRGQFDSFRQDWQTLFDLLAEGKIAPLIAETFPILQAAQANALLESGSVTGNIALLSPELI